MSLPCTTEELRGLAEAALRQAETVLATIAEPTTLVERTDVEVPAPTHHELETELHASFLALHTPCARACANHTTAVANPVSLKDLSMWCLQLSRFTITLSTSSR